MPKYVQLYNLMTKKKLLRLTHQTLSSILTIALFFIKIATETITLINLKSFKEHHCCIIETYRTVSIFTRDDIFRHSQFVTHGKFAPP